MTTNSSARLSIPFDVLEEHIHCSICLCVIRGAVLTPCGHRYCNRCITEWIGRNHTCPCCNSALTANEFYCDVHFDGLVEEILLHRDQAEEQYFNNMFEKATQETPTMQGTNNNSPFETILKKHIKASIMSHNIYFNKLRQECHRKIDLLDTNVSLETLSKVSTGFNVEGMSKDELKSTLEKNLEESEQLAAEAFDKYLTENVPTLEILPVSVSVYVNDKQLRIPNVTLKPNDCLSVIKKDLEAAITGRCDKILSWTEDGGEILLLVGPLGKASHYNVEELMLNQRQDDDVAKLKWNSKPIFQFHMRPGSEIVLQNIFKTQADLPKVCFTTVYKKSGPEPVDYFSCSKCNMKWICKSCSQVCHAGHDIAPFVLNHTPTWACCYCPKKKLCKIQEN